MTTYKIINIYDEDFGCEGLPEGQLLSVNVLLENCKTKERLTISYPDAELYEKNININDIVFYENKKLKK